MITPTSQHPIRVLLADDDQDDRYLFDRELKLLPFNTQLTTAEDGEKLMNYLENSVNNLPDILFLDHNMPRKNGAECLQEIKAHPKLKVLPVIMYSTYVHDDLADVFYKNAAHYYLRKTDQKELKKSLCHILTLIRDKRFSQPARNRFVLIGDDVSA